MRGKVKQGGRPVGILGYPYEEEGAQIVEQPHGGCTAPLQERSYHVQEDDGVKHLQHRSGLRINLSEVIVSLLP